MLPFVVGFQICRICIHHLVATFVTPAASSLLSPLANLKRVNSWWMLVELAFFLGAASWTSGSAGLLLGLVEALEDDSDSSILGGDRGGGRTGPCSDSLALHSRTSESWIYVEFILNRLQCSSLNSHTFTQWIKQCVQKEGF